MDHWRTQSSLEISVVTADSNDPGERVEIRHGIPVPSTSGYGDEGFWRQWLFEAIVTVERHEAGEFFRVGEDRPFLPSHGLAPRQGSQGER